MLDRFFINFKGSSDSSVSSLTKTENGSEVDFFVDINEMMNDLAQFVEFLFYLEFS